MFKKFFITFVICVALLPVTLMAMQEPPPTPRVEITGVNATEIPTITVTANVFDSLGQPVRGLTAADFSLVGEIASLGTITNVANITDDDLSFAVVLVIDASSSMAETPFQRAQEAARTFINSIGPNDPVAIMTFNRDVYLIQDYTTDKAALLGAIDSLVYGGRTALYEAAVTAVDKAAESPLPRRVVVLLSDGAEYGGVSNALRGDALQEARQRGVPVYTIGLGFGIDRTYLMELSAGTNAQNFESPTPDELVDIYRNLADTLRSQYVITLNADLPLDGTEYDLDIEVTTAEGTARASTILRAPIPVPIVSAPEVGEPISEPTDITVNVLADEQITSAQMLLDGVDVSENLVVEGGETDVTVPTTSSYSLPVDPFDLAPGAHSITFSATDADGDTGTASFDFEVAALPSIISLTTNLDVSAGDISDPLIVTVDVVGQTPVSSATHSVDGDTPVEFTGDLPYILNIDPQVSTPGEHTLTVTVVNEGGATGAADLTYSVAPLPPVFSVTGLETGQLVEETTVINVDVIGSQSQTADITAAINGSEIAIAQDVESASVTINPMDLQPGNNTLSITAADANGQAATVEVTFEVAALPPQVTVSGLTAGETIEDNRTVSVDTTSQTPISGVTFIIDGDEVDSQTDAPFSFELDVAEIAPDAHILSITVENEGGASATVDIPFIVSEAASLTATAMAQPTSTPAPTDTRPPTSTALPSATPTPNLDATATQDAALQIAAAETQQAADAQATNHALVLEMMTEESINGDEAQATLDAQATQDAQATVNAQATTDAQATQDAQAMLDEQATTTAVVALITATFEAEATANAQAAANAQLTADARATRNAERTLTAESDEATQAAADAQATLDARATATAEAAEVAQVPTEETEEATEVVPTEEATAEAQAEEPSATPGESALTRTPAATPPDVSTLTAENVEEAPPASDTTPILVIIVVLIVILIVVYFVLRGGRRSRAQ